MREQENDKHYSIWGVRHPSKLSESGITIINMFPQWEWLKEGSNNKKCLTNIDRKLYSQIELRDNTGVTIASIITEQMFVTRKQEQN